MTLDVRIWSVSMSLMCVTVILMIALVLGFAQGEGTRKHFLLVKIKEKKTITEDDHYQMEAETIDHHGHNNRNLASITTRQGQGWTVPTTPLYQTNPTRAPYQTYPTRALYQTEPTRAHYQTDPTARSSGMYRCLSLLGLS